MNYLSRSRGELLAVFLRLPKTDSFDTDSRVAQRLAQIPTVEADRQKSTSGGIVAQTNKPDRTLDSAA